MIDGGHVRGTEVVEGDFSMTGKRHNTAYMDVEKSCVIGTKNLNNGVLMLQLRRPSHPFNIAAGPGSAGIFVVSSDGDHSYAAADFSESIASVPNVDLGQEM